MPQYPRDQRYDRRDRDEPLVSADEIKEIIQKSNGKLLVEKAENLGNHFSRSMTTSQIRNVFGSVKRMEQIGFEKSRSEFLLLKPKLAYAAGRENKIKPLQAVLSSAIDAVGDSKKGFENFCRFFEAILCYHKFYGGK